ncbi:hypothetical protein EJB05_07375 [Eragrostis curvula]|uniref:Uncharacterized protein n=1 Tax=Eragrostis curvula TaxID=38414 RepID=A0A5J9WIJ8_9POAL|nr:hypothetical protein EJB05_07375 [Eragrostis curvula]
MFWKDNSGRSSSGSSREQNGVGPFGQIRVLIVGDSGVGKSSLVHLILKGSAIARPSQTVGCTVGIKHVTYGSAGGSSNNISDAERNFFVELWDVSGHERYKACRSIFYSQINGVIFVYDLSQRKTKTNLNKWAVEIAETGTFSAPLGSGGPGGLPVPYLVIANKMDIVPRDGTKVSSGNLVDLARQWAEKQGLLRCSEELPLTESFPGNSGLVSVSSLTDIILLSSHLTCMSFPIFFNGTSCRPIDQSSFDSQAAKQARYDKEAVIKFFRMLIRRRYFSNEPPAPSPWSLTPRPDTILPVEALGVEADSFQRKSYGDEGFRYNGVVTPLPAQRNLAPPPTLNPQPPVFSLDSYRYHRFSSSSLPDVGSNRTSRDDVNI